MKNKTREQEKKFPVREGQKDSSVLHDKKPPSKNAYPHPTVKDKQMDHQPEFTEVQPNKKSDGTTKPM